MGYDTEYYGVLKFSTDLRLRQVAHLEKMLGADYRCHPEWRDEFEYFLTYTNLKWTKDYLGLEWDGSEGSHSMVETLKLIIRSMREIVPEFGLEGILEADGEELDDNYNIIVKNVDNIDEAVIIENCTETEDLIECPHCKEKFILDKK